MIYGEEVVEQVSFDLGLMDDENDESENGEIVWKVALVWRSWIRSGTAELSQEVDYEIGRCIMEVLISHGWF